MFVYKNAIEQEALMKDVIKGNQFEVKFCKRCGDEKKVNKFSLCKTCETEVDYEYSVMYETKTKE
jgi:hypothetical protein